MMKAAFGAALATVALAVPTPDLESRDFDAWRLAHGKTYDGKAEHESRRSIFAANLDYIDAHNAEGHSYTLGVGPFTDLTNEEFAARFTEMEFKPDSERDEVYLPEVRTLEGQAADGVDWRGDNKGTTWGGTNPKGITAVTPIKDQKKCGGCWAFSTTGAIEGANAVAGNFQADGKPLSLSEQELVSCSKNGNKGCQGGSMDLAMQWVQKNQGLDSELDYPYTSGGGQNGQCDTSKERKHVGAITGHKDVPQQNEKQLEAAVAQQPVSIAIEADKQVFQHYKTGVMDSELCGTKLDHGVLLVGYGTDSGKDYWILKNSWNTVWGDQGYMKLGKGTGSKKGICGVNMQPVYATATKGPPPAPGPPAPPPGPGGQCNVPVTERHSCGLIFSKTQCESRGCCWDATHLFATHCFHPGDGPNPGPPSPPPGPGGQGHYEKPHPGCMAGEDPIRIQGLNGDFCSPECSRSQGCPGAPAGSGAIPQCILSSSGSSSPTNCALLCGGGGGTHGGHCPSGMTCETIQGTGICMYQ